MGLFAQTQVVAHFYMTARVDSKLRISQIGKNQQINYKFAK
jgi:hypothetical protein